MQLESPQKCIAWESNPIKTKGKSLQKHSIEAPLEMINEVHYLIEVEDKGIQAFTTPQLSTCLNQHIDIFVANPLKNEMDLVLSITATPVTTLKEVSEIPRETNSKYKEYPLSESERNELNVLLVEFSDVLADKNDPLGQTDKLEHEIDTGNESPIRQKPYRLSPSQKEKIEIAPYRYEACGKIERVNPILTTGIAHHINSNHTDWDLLLPGVLFAHRTSVVRTLGVSPFQLLFGRLPMLPPDIENTPQTVLTTDQDDQLKRITSSLEYADSILKRKLNRSQVKTENDNENPDYKQYPLESFVWLTSHKKEKGRSPKFLPKYSGPHQIVEVIPPSNYKLKTPSGKLLKRPIHHSRLKLHKGDKPTTPIFSDESLISEDEWEEEDDIPLIELQKRLREEEEENLPLSELKKRINKN